MTAQCTGTPISWWRLERYHLGELAADDRTEIEAHVAACAACSACLARIDADAAIPLPALPKPRTEIARDKPARARWRSLVVPATAGLALAAAAIVAIGRVPHDPTQGDRTELARAKGGDVDFVLVGGDDDVVSEAGGTYHDGETFKALVTCPPSLIATWDLVVIEQGRGAFPLAPAQDLACGNLAPLPGAFRLTGREPVDICVMWSEEGPIDRSSLTFGGPPAAWAKPATCKHLEPSR